MPVITSIPRELTAVMQVQRTLYRPAFFRNVLFVDNSMPEYVQNIHTRQLTHAASVQPAGPLGSQVPMAQVNQASTSVSVIKYVAGYEYSDDELMEAQAGVGISLSAERALANSLAAEQKLDEIAAQGDTTVGLGGFGNNGTVPTVTAVTKAAGGTTWAVATALEIVEDLWAMALGVRSNSMQNYKAAAVLLPEAQHVSAVSTTNASTDKNAIQIFREQSGGQIDIQVWDRLDGLGAGTTPRAMALGIPVTGAATGEGAPAKMDIPREFIQSGSPLQVQGGWSILQNFRTAGVTIRNPEAFTYMDAL